MRTAVEDVVMVMVMVMEADTEKREFIAGMVAATLMDQMLNGHRAIDVTAERIDVMAERITVRVHLGNPVENEVEVDVDNGFRDRLTPLSTQVHTINRCCVPIQNAHGVNH